MRIAKREKEQELFHEFIEVYDERACEAKQQNFLKMIDIVLAAFIIIVICMVSVRP
jgi:hypothetical protein